MKKTIAMCIGILVCILFPKEIHAAKESDIPYEVFSSDGQSVGNLSDGNVNTYVHFGAGTKVKIKSNEKIHSIYFEWLDIPSVYEIRFNGISVDGGKNAFLHEFIEITEGAFEVEFIFKSGVMLSNVYVLGDGEIPKEIQRWKSPCDKADMLIISTHADDEVLFMGGVIAEYAGERQLDVQILYYFSYYQAWWEREHEKLDGLWAMGVRNYPDCGNYRESMAQNKEESDILFEGSLDFMVEKIRRYKPDVCVSQDVRGEYGHFHHLGLVRLVQKALEVSADENVCVESAKKYGTHDVPKTYLHLFKENRIKLDTKKPLVNFDGKNALEVVSEAFLQHKTQNDLGFFVSDEYQYGIADFGLYRSLVGVDSGNDMMENISLNTESETTQEVTETTTQEVTEQATQKVQDEKKDEAEKNINLMPVYIVVPSILIIIIFIISLIRTKRR